MILIAEDEHDLRLSMHMLLTSVGLKCCTVQKGSEVIKAVAEHDDIDIIIMDLFLPGELNGWQVIEQLQANEKWRQVPILVVTGYPDVGVIPGSHATLLKPTDPREMLDMVNCLLAKKARQCHGPRVPLNPTDSPP
jgi:adenylate cyclase